MTTILDLTGYTRGIPATLYSEEELKNIAKSQIYHDEGAGVTQMSVEYFTKLKGKLGRIYDIRVDSDREFSTEIFCDAGYVLLSGTNCGYGGTGPHGTVELLTMMGFKSEMFERKIFENQSVRIDCRSKFIYW